VLGFAAKPLCDIPEDNLEEMAETELIWLGLVGMLDAPGKEVKEAVLRCREAGIRPIMITGDHQLTAKAIATELGIAHPEDPILTGRDLQHITPKELEKLVSEVSVYARVAPEHKLQIVRALQNKRGICGHDGRWG
jgi:Ca2+-transporting ATPase